MTRSASKCDRCGAVVLCGGGSRRMGRDKAWLPFGPNETMLQRVVRRLGEVTPAENIVVVAGVGQHLPELPPGTLIEHDEKSDGGPLPALVRGLSALGDRVDLAFAAASDAPLLRPAFVEAMFALLTSARDVDATSTIAVAPRDASRGYPLAAALHASVAPIARQAMERGARSLYELLDAVGVVWIDAEQLRAVDPKLDSLLNCNSPEEYESALLRAGEAEAERASRSDCP